MPGFKPIADLPIDTLVIRITRMNNQGELMCQLLTKDAQAGLMPLIVAYGSDHITQVQKVIGHLSNAQRSQIHVLARDAQNNKGFELPSKALADAALDMIEESPYDQP